MANKKSKSTGKISNKGRTEAHKRQEEKRQAKFAKRREEGKAYKYKANPYTEGTIEYYNERTLRAEKNKCNKVEYARLRSIFAKLDNWLSKQKSDMKLKENSTK